MTKTYDRLPVDGKTTAWVLYKLFSMVFGPGLICGLVLGIMIFWVYPHVQVFGESLWLNNQTWTARMWLTAGAIAGGGLIGSFVWLFSQPEVRARI